MIEEIIYTSAPKGLRSGSRGFCTVISTAGMAANMAERLESMSGYRHAFPLNHPDNSLNPVNFVHVTTRLAGEKRHVISRVADAGQDYSGRTNKLAHHVALENVQSLVAGPARLLDSGLLVDAWDGKLETRAPRTVSSPEVPAKVALSAWKQLTGDGGWAGFVAEKLLAGKAPVNVIFKAGTDTLPLVVEVIDLVPIPKRWQVTFSTYFTRLLAGTECQLRFFLHGTSEATTIRNDARAVIVDLATSLPPAEGGDLVATSRSGVVSYSAPAAKAVSSGQSRSSSRSVSDAELDNFLDDGDQFLESDGDDITDNQLAIQRSRNARLTGTFRRKKRTMPVPVIASIAVVLIAAMGMVAFLLSRPASNGNPVTVVPPSVNFEPVIPTEPVADSDASTDTANVDHQQQMAAEPVKKLESPFGDRRPFDQIRQALAESFASASGSVNWQLASPGQPTEAEVWDVYVSSIEPVSLSCRSDLITVTELANTKDRKWQLSVDDVALGAFQLEQGVAQSAATLIWKWEPAFSKTDDVYSASAAALRAFRNAEVLIQSAELNSPYVQPADSITIRMVGDSWPRFSHLGSGTSNLEFQLGVPAPGMMDNQGNQQRQSRTISLEADSPGDVTLGIVEECNALIANHDAFLLPSITADQNTAVWELGLIPKGGSPKDGEPFGKYTVVSDQTPGIVNLSFEWLPNVDSSFAAPLQWMPIELSTSGQSHVLFPRGPQKYRAEELLDLGQGDQCTFPSGQNIDLPLRFPNDTVAVNFEVSIQSGTQVVKSQLKSTRESPTPDKDIAFFQLQSPIGLQATNTQPTSNLGTAKLTATPVKTESGVIPAAIQLRSVASFNRSNLFHLNPLRIVNVFDPLYWDDKGRFRQQEFVTAAKALLAPLKKVSGILPPELRNPETRLSRYAKQKDPFKRIEKQLRDSVTKLDRLLKSSDDDLRTIYPRVFPAALGHRNAPKVKPLLQQQRDELEKVRTNYSDTQWKEDTETVRAVQEQLAQLVAGVNISLELQRKDGTILRMYFVSTRGARGAK